MYGLGYDVNKEDGVIPFAKGKCVAKNREKVKHIDGYLTLLTYKLASKEARAVLVAQMQ